MKSEPEQIPKGLIFSSGNPLRRKKTLWICLFLVLIQLCLIWPVYPLFSSATPLIAGLPLSFVWVIAMVLVSFTILLSYYLTDRKTDRNQKGDY